MEDPDIPNPIVSVIMPVYNGQKYMAEAIDSILCQDLEKLELIVIDDGSTDATAGILSTIKDPRLRIIRNEKNAGVAYSLNRAIRESRGIYIARMDSDDIALKFRLSRQVGFLEAHPGISLVGGGIKCFGISNSRIHYWPDHESIHANCLFNTPFAHPVVCWRKCDFERNDLFYQEVPATAEDYDLWERACRCVRVANLDSTLIRYRIDPQIKISRYLEQQFIGARQVRIRLLEVSGICLDGQMLESLHQIGEGSFVPSIEFLQNAARLFLEIIKENQRIEYFDSKCLSRVLSKWWHGLLVKHTHLVGWTGSVEYSGRKSPVKLCWTRRSKLILNSILSCGNAKKKASL